MAEIGVAAAVVGILGFGVQVCEGLWDYYSAYKDQDETVAKMLNSAALLKATCKILHSTTTDLEGKPFPKESVDNVKKSVENCNDDLSRLKKKLDKLKEYQTPTVKGFKGWLARTGKSLYPFRESTLIKLREIIDESVGNLELALETLNLCVFP
jgi:ankyrin repeat domain-containing protein 50